jgi:serine/threonine-protein kinase
MQSVLAGRYRLERQLGKGGMGSVWLAEHLSLRSWVAVKLMDPAIAATPEGAERFRREAQAAASLRSAHVVQVLDYGVHEATPFLVMELMHGESLAACLEREKRLTPERTLAVMTQVARALGRAHSAGIVHRDLKPDNVFLVREDDQELVKILDFGIAKTPQSTFGGMETKTGVTMGTPYYMSPEQVEGKKAVDFRTDLWAMAVIACECMTGVRPFDGSTFGELLLNICARPVAPPSSQGLILPGFDEWFARATNRDQDQRFASVQDMVSGLKDVVQNSGRGMLSGALPIASSLPGAAQSGAMPATVPGAAPPMQTGAGAFTSSAPSVSSMNTAQSFEVPKRSNALLLVLVALGLLVGAVVVTMLVLRPKTETATTSPSAAPSVAAAPSPASAAVAIASAPDAPASAVPIKASAHPASGGQHKDTTAPAAPAAHEPSPIAATPPTPPAPAPAAPAPAAAPPVAAALNGGAKTVRCFSDPFSGQIRAAPAGRADTFACKQDPFTGKYKRL